MLKINKEEEEKLTVFEEFEAELKSIIFRILYVMLKEDDDDSIWTQIILSVGDGLQTLGLSFNISIPFPWKNDGFRFYFESALFMIQIAYWCYYLTWESYVAIFYIFNILILLVIFDIIYIGYSFHTNRFTVFWPLTILRSTCGLFVTVLFMPLMDLLTSMAQCDFEDGLWVQQFFPFIECWKGVHLFHTIFGLVVSGLFVVVCTVVSLTYYESKDDPDDPGAKVDNRCEVVNNTAKIVGVIVTTFFITEQYQWMVAIVLVIFSYIVFIKCHVERSYYNETMNRVTDTINGIYLWSCVLLILALLLKDTEYTGSVPLFFLGSPIIGAIFFTMDFRGDKLLMKPIEQFENGDEWYRKIKYYIALIHNKDTDRKAAIELKGFIYDHEETCEKKDCPLKLYKNNITSAIEEKKKKIGKNFGIENNSLLWNYANRLFQQGIARYPNTTLMGIAYVQFLNERMSNKMLAELELDRVEKLNPPFDQQFVIYRYRRLMEDGGDSAGNEEAGGQSGNADLVAVITFNNHYDQCHECIKKAAKYHMAFWTELEKKEPDLANLSDTGSKINTIIAEIEEHWTHIQKLSPNHPDALRMYGKFLTEILNDKEAGQELFSKEKENTGYKIPLTSTFSKGGKSASNPAERWLNRIGEYPCILASGQYNKFGEIMLSNLEVSRTFGYTQMELQGKKMEILMPKLYAKRHDALVKASLQRAEEGDQGGDDNNERRTDKVILAKSKTGYLIALQLETKVFFLQSQGAILGALFKCEKKSYNCCYLLLNSKEDVVGVSSLCVETLRINNNLIREYRIPISELAPDFTDASKLEQFRTKDGGAIKFFYPEIEKKQENKPDHINYSMSKDSKDPNEKDEDVTGEVVKSDIKASKESIKMKCHIMNIIFTGDDAPSGYIVRLEKIPEEKGSSKSLKMSEESAHPEFQVIFDPMSYQYVCGWSKDDIQKEKERGLMRGNTLGVIYEDLPKVQEEGEGEDDKAGKRVQRQTTIDINFKRIKDYGKGIKTKRLNDGVFIEINEINKMKEKELEERAKLEENKRKIEEKGLMSTEDVKESLKSRKGLIAVVKDKSDPPSIVNLKITGYIVILVFLTITCTEFGIIVTKFKTINENMELIRSSYRRITLFMTITYYLNMAIHAKDNDDTTNDEKRYSYFPIDFSEFVNDKKEKMSTALTEIYKLQNALILSKIEMSDGQKSLMNNKVVALEFKSSHGNKKTSYYTLTEAVLEMTSSIFTITNFADRQYTIDNDDIEFVLYNLFKDVYDKIMDSSKYYLEDAKHYIRYRKTIILIMFIISVLLLFISIAALFPGISKVRTIRTQVLSLFLGIPLADVRKLIKSCKKYSKKKDMDEMDQNAEQSDTTGSQEHISLSDMEEDINALPKEPQKMKRFSRRRKFVNNKSVNTSFFFRYTFGVFVLTGLHIANYVLLLKYLNKVFNALPELNYTIAAHPLDATVLSMTQQLIAHHNILPLTGSETFDLLMNEKLNQMQLVHHTIQRLHLENQNIYPKEYRDDFKAVILSSICDLGIDFTFDCESYLDGVATKGLGTILMQYIEIIRELSESYDKIMKDESITEQERNDLLAILVNGTAKANRIGEAETIVHEIMELIFKKLLDDLMNSFNGMYEAQLTQRIIFFVVILVLLLMVFFLMWVPFLNRLSMEIWRTKCMLTIIPREVIAQMKSIQKFLNDPNIFSTKGEA